MRFEDDMSEGVKNFICNRQWKIKNNNAKWATFAFRVLLFVYMCFVVTVAESIIIGVLLWIDLWLLLLFPTNERMKNKKLRNGYYGGTVFFTGIICLYLGYRIAFAGSWILCVYLIYALVLPMVWLLGVMWNIKHDIYASNHKNKSKINVFTFLYLFLVTAMLIFVEVSMVLLQMDGKLCVLSAILIVLNSVMMATSTTFILQWALMLKYSYDEED